ncbi:MAG: hypothetical protein PHV73_05015 [Eubacteriales bacterium]|nr:hypothetical protein [Eubacteriales bacterium]
MSKTSEIIKYGVLVTVFSLLAMVASFALYYLLFTLFERTSATYRYVSWLRLGYGIVWIIFCLLMYRSKIPEWVKAVILSTALTTFMAAIGVQLYETPVIAGFIILLTIGAAFFLLRVMKKEWYHYYAVAISMLAALLYL